MRRDYPAAAIGDRWIEFGPKPSAESPLDIRASTALALGLEHRAVADRVDVRPFSPSEDTALLRFHELWSPVAGWIDKPEAIRLLATPTLVEQVGGAISVPDVLWSEVERLRGLGTIPGMIKSFDLELGFRPADQAVEFIETLLQTLADAGTPEARLFVVEALPELEPALRGIRVATALTFNRSAFTNRAAGQGIESARSLEGHSSSLDPALISVWLNRLAPFVDGCVLQRHPHLLIITFGGAVPGDGNRRFGADLNEFGTHADTSGSEIESWNTVPRLEHHGIADGLRTWTAHLDAMMNVFSDPRYFADSDGQFDPVARLAMWLDVQRLFHNVHAIQRLGTSDRQAQRSMFFDVLDTFQALTDARARSKNSRSAIGEWTRPSNLTERLSLVRKEIGPRSDPVWKRLRQVIGDIESAAGTAHWLDELVVGTKIVLGGRSMSPDAAIGFLIETLRHCYTHSYSAALEDEPVRTAAILGHDGELTRCLGLLAQLFLFDLVARPADGTTTMCHNRSKLLRA